MKAVLVALFAVACAHTAHLPQTFKKCNRKDPNADKCYLEAAQIAVSQVNEAHPGVNLPNCEPLEITELKIGAGSQGVVNVDQHFKNCKLYGITTAKLDVFRINFEEKYIYGEAVVPVLKKVCDYDLDGKILVLPIRGTGKSTVLLNNLKITLRFDYEEFTKKGKTYMSFNKQKVTLDADSTSFHFEDLFNGDKQLGDNINKVLNENHKEVFNDVRSGYEEGIGLVLLQVVHNLFAKVSMEEAFD